MNSEAEGISGNGQVVVGADLLRQAGVALDGWSLSIARGVSEDGRVIVGDGINGEGMQEGWIAVLPPGHP